MDYFTNRISNCVRFEIKRRARSDLFGLVLQNSQGERIRDEIPRMTSLREKANEGVALPTVKEM